MKKLIKVICLILIVTLITTQLCVLCFSAVGLSESNFTVFYENEPCLFKVFKSQDETYIAVSDLMTITRYSFMENDKSFVFSLGEKKVQIFKNNNNIVVIPMNFSIKYSGAKQRDGKWYLPVSEVLPWLSLNCKVEDGYFCVYSDEITVWEIMKEITDKKISFNILNEFDNSTDAGALMIIAEVIDGLLNFKLNKVIIADTKTAETLSYLDAYKECLLEMATDDYLLSDKASDFVKNTKNFGTAIDSFGNILGFTNDEDAYNYLRSIDTTGDTAEAYSEVSDMVNGGKMLKELSSAVTPVMNWWKTLEAIGNTPRDYYDAVNILGYAETQSSLLNIAATEMATELNSMEAATIDAVLNWMKNKAFNEIIKDSTQLLGSYNVAISAVNLALSAFWPANKVATKISKLPVYGTIQKAASDYANKMKFNKADIEGIHNIRVSLQMSLLASAQSYKALNSLVGLFDKNLSKKKTDDLNNIDLLLTKLAWCASTEKNDAVCDKTETVEEIKVLLQQADNSYSNENYNAAEFAKAYMAQIKKDIDAKKNELEYYNDNQSGFAFLDLNFDGTPELICSGSQGTSIVSYSSYYSYNSGKVKEIFPEKSRSEMEMRGIDWCIAEPRLYTENGINSYIVIDSSGPAYGISYYKLSYNNGNWSNDVIATSVTVLSEEYRPILGKYDYYIGENKVSEQEYNNCISKGKKVNYTFKGYTDFLNMDKNEQYKTVFVMCKKATKK